MSRVLRSVVFISSFVVFLNFQGAAQETGWRIAPNRINIQVGADRWLQLLDDSAQELFGAIWSVDDPEKADIREEDGRAVLHAKLPGVVRVSAARGGEIIR